MAFIQGDLVIMPIILTMYSEALKRQKIEKKITRPFQREAKQLLTSNNSPTMNPRSVGFK